MGHWIRLIKEAQEEQQDYQVECRGYKWYEQKAKKDIQALKGMKKEEYQWLMENLYRDEYTTKDFQELFQEK